MSAINVARAGKRGNICVGNNVSATMCPRLSGPLDCFIMASYAQKFLVVLRTLVKISGSCSKDHGIEGRHKLTK